MGNRSIIIGIGVLLVIVVVAVTLREYAYQQTVYENRMRLRLYDIEELTSALWFDGKDPKEVLSSNRTFVEYAKSAYKEEVGRWIDIEDEQVVGLSGYPVQFLWISEQRVRIVDPGRNGIYENGAGDDCAIDVDTERLKQGLPSVTPVR